VLVRRLELLDFRNYEHASLELGPGMTAVVGANGQGKSNLLEALAYLSTRESFRGAPGAAMVRDGCAQAVVRAEVEQADGRVVSVECELQASGPDRVLVNKQRLQRVADLLGVLRTTVFSPDDLAVVKEGPALRRRFLDQAVVALHPREDAVRRDLERILRHKATLLKQAGGRLDEAAAFTLDVWDAKLAEAGEAQGKARADLVDALGPEVARAYRELAGEEVDVILHYDPPWRAVGLAAALAAARPDEVRRQACLVGPHRDDLDVVLAGRPARTHASQGEQRTLTLALRLAAHRLVERRIGTAPVLLLDDVFSELDPHRSAALVQHLPPGQVVLTTAGPLPDGATPAQVFHVDHGCLREDAGTR
jgi:DNA replication and repair protein RecF